jgi:coenzyme F420-reducing hydrogenase delta subunit
MTVYDPEAFGQALKKLAEGDDSPYVHIAKAQRLMEAAELHALAFGLICLPIVKGDYDDSREFLVKNLRTGTKNMQDVIAGLNRVAANYNGVEQANMILPEDLKLPEIKVKETNVENYIEGAVLYFWKIGVIAMLVKGINSASAKLAITAGVSVVLWLGFMPDDAALSKAHSQWKAAADELAKFDDELSTKVSNLNRTWSESTAQQTFNTWIDNFAQEVDECRDAIEKGFTTISTLETTLNTQSHTAFVTAIANLVVLAAMEIAGWSFPPSRPAWKAAMEVVGAIFSITTGTWISFAASSVKALIMTILPIALSTFVEEKKGSGSDSESNGVDFKEVALSQDAIDTLVSDATA